MLVGFASGTIPAPGLNHALIKNYTILGLHWGLYNTFDPPAIAACHAELTALAAAGSIRPLVGAEIGLANVPRGLTDLAAGTTTGRVVMRP